MQKTEISDEVYVGKSSRSKAPVFVVGCPRSGTTLLYHMLLSAGNFAMYRAESQVFNVLEPRFGDLGKASHREKLLQAWFGSALFSKTGLDVEEVKEKVMGECRNGGDFLRLVMQAMARRQNVERWADSTPEHVLYLDRIKATIPDALAIHMIRDGRDVALSLEKQAWIRPFPWDRAKSLEVAALYWEWIVEEGRKRGKVLGGDYVEIHYEDLVQNPREVLARLSRFVEQELDYDRITKVGVGTVSHPNSSFAVETEEGEFTPVERWKNSLDARQLGVLDELIGETLQELGYPLQSSGTPAAGRSLARMRSSYQWYFDMKLRLKRDTSLARALVSRDLSWV
jgi:sulfotransferase family protein